MTEKRRPGDRIPRADRLEIYRHMANYHRMRAREQLIRMDFFNTLVTYHGLAPGDRKRALRVALIDMAHEAHELQLETSKYLQCVKDKYDLSGSYCANLLLTWRARSTTV